MNSDIKLDPTHSKSTPFQIQSTIPKLVPNTFKKMQKKFDLESRNHKPTCNSQPKHNSKQKGTTFAQDVGRKKTWAKCWKSKPKKLRMETKECGDSDLKKI